MHVRRRFLIAGLCTIAFAVGNIVSTQRSAAQPPPDCPNMGCAGVSSCGWSWGTMCVTDGQSCVWEVC